MTKSQTTAAHAALAGYYANSITASVAADYAAGRVTVVQAGVGVVHHAPKRDRLAEAQAAVAAVDFRALCEELGVADILDEVVA